MKNSVILKEVVFAGITTYFKFSSDSDGAIEFFALLNALVDSFVVIFEVERIIIESTKSHFDMQLAKLHFVINNYKGFFLFLIASTY